MHRFQLYRLTPSHAVTSRVELDSTYEVRRWTAERDGWRFPRLGIVRSAIYRTFDAFAIFRNEYYGGTIIKDGDELVHHTLIIPKYFRFPFMDDSDVQIGFIWTSPHYRSKGLAVAGVCTCLDILSDFSGTVWYIVEEGNYPSIALAERIGFRMAGRGHVMRESKWSLLGRYVVDIEEGA